MKKTNILVLALVLAACSKESQSPIRASNVSNLVINPEDTIKFESQIHNDGIDDHSGKTVEFSDIFSVPSDTGIYLKALVFSVTKSTLAKITTAKIFIDGIQKTLSITGDSLKFLWTNPLRLKSDGEVRDSSKNHSIDLRIISANGGKSGEWYKTVLQRAVFIRKYPKPQTTCVVYNLPQQGAKETYR